MDDLNTLYVIAYATSAISNVKTLDNRHFSRLEEVTASSLTIQSGFLGGRCSGIVCRRFRFRSTIVVDFAFCLLQKCPSTKERLPTTHHFTEVTGMLVFPIYRKEKGSKFCAVVILHLFICLEKI